MEGERKRERKREKEKREKLFQGSRWVIQAVAMDARISDGFSLLPDQMSTLNALLIMIFIPIFQVNCV